MDELGTMEFLDLVWGEEDCYVDLPSKAGGHWIPWYAEWPADRPLVRGRIDSCGQDREDIYFSVARFRSKGRRIADVLPTTWLWADLDRIDPVFLDEEQLLPTVAWESSPGRYQCLWRLSKALRPESQTVLNRRLTNAIGADKGGYDLTQVLRPIDTWNFKYDPIADVELLWYDSELVYKPSEVVDAIRTIESESGIRQRPSTHTTAQGTDKRIPARARRLLSTPEDRVVQGERSHRLWEIEKLLAKAGFGEEEIFALVWPCAWNKHRERRSGGENQLRREIAKATSEVVGVRARSTDHEPRREVSEDLPKEPERDVQRRTTSPFVDYATFLATNIETPRWLIENIWSASSHGIIGGEPKTSKSSFTLAMALSVATGKPFLGIEEYQVPTPGPVLLIQEENAPWVVQDRLRKIAQVYGLIRKRDVEISEAPEGSIAEHVVRLDFPNEAPLKLLNNYGFDLTDEEDLILLEEEVRREGAVLVIIDPLYLTMPGVNLSQSHEVGPLLQWLMALRHNHNCAVALVHHWAKANEQTKMRRSGQRLMGTGFFHGWLESGLYMEKLESENNGTLRVRVEREFRNTAPQSDIEVAWELGEPGELDMQVSVHDWNLEGLIASTLDQLLPQCDERGLNIKVLMDKVSVNGETHSPEAKLNMAKRVRAMGYVVKRKKYPRGMAYLIMPEANNAPS